MVLVWWLEDYHSNCSLPRSAVDAVAEIRTELKSWRYISLIRLHQDRR